MPACDLSMRRKAGILTAALVAAVFLWLLFTLPPRPAMAAGGVSDAIRARTIAGAFHVHSVRSDGSGSRAEIAAAAARAGLQFVVITDHGDATRSPDPPAYIDGVLCIDAVEISSNGGHVVAFDMPAAPYPLGGEAAAVVEDIVRLGGMPVIAHPDSPKPELAWRAWSAPAGGLEWLNLDSAWRDEPFGRLARIAVGSFFRPAPALAATLARPAELLTTWDRIASNRAVVGLAGHDAHGGLRRAEEYRGDQGWSLPGFGSYEVAFRTFSTRVILDAPLSGDPVGDARRLSQGVRRGSLFTAIDALASPPAVDFAASLGATRHQMGSEVLLAQPLHLSFRSNMPQGARAVLLANGVEASSSTSGDIQFDVPGVGVYRVEVRTAGADVPWIVTNPIYVRGAAGQRSVERREASGVSVMDVEGAGVVEKDAESSATLGGESGSRVLKFRLRPGERVSQYAALAIPLAQDPPEFNQLAFTGKSSAPLRVSVQLRFEAAGGARWGHSVYMSPEAREIVIPLDRLVALDRPGQPLPDRGATSLLFVVDLTNAAPGSEGEFEISSLRLARR